jgi:1-acyl-sn-glycerol-3-phosphate acyltransferase
LKNGVSVVIFPEGTRTKTGLMGKFKKGAFLIATDLHLPILPITIKGSYERVIKGSFNFRPGTIEMIFHQPVDVNEYLPDNTQGLIEHTRNVISGN